ncbi:N-acylneuraminate cytidylyltransferase-like isoform X1 [Dinothrombium tinctorium]|uniref:N-acylneuraminate cytidylyltransferase-like isoform X1 n=1 Tax=Dinothrombium tinctorium TaxID=1965070 RepID=A0A3S3PTG3_9ACAR|nr:N-acylneuraminate cytidylyltransferase-like isoform X1 [Dinothrombium tinctorium]RWS07900.1 N-acylneuraminate cytidylyltransferase-like isoform X1 [Dinothrombium tinctorium]RWS07909.1 N-acylneuraminate cytidylyltransferase-like isoform X1 [Dinothrombium tinctorium]
MKVCALILARESSKSIESKNLVKLNDVPLLSYVIKPALECEFFDEIWVSTDSEAIIDLIERIHRSVHIFKRSKQMATDECSSLAAVQEFLNFKKDAEIICLLQATSPSLYPQYLREAFEKMKQFQYDSVFSVTRDHKLRWSNCGNGVMRAINFDVSRRPRRQDWDGELVESGHFYFATRELIMSRNLLQNEQNTGYVEMPIEMCIELDYQWQIPVLEIILKNHGYIKALQTRMK